MTNCPRSWRRQRAYRLDQSAYDQKRAVHVTVCTRHRYPHFVDSRLADPVWVTVLAVSRPIAVCLMPDHLHLLLDDSSTLVSTLHRVKSMTTRAAWDVGHRGRLWQRSYQDHVVRSEEKLRQIAEYVVLNPVRAGLAVERGDYPYQAWFPDRCPS